jgi:hypothetical protein
MEPIPWLLCDAPTLLHTLLAMGLNDDPRVQRAVAHLAALAEDGGWRCGGNQGRQSAWP